MKRYISILLTLIFLCSAIPVNAVDNNGSVPVQSEIQESSQEITIEETTDSTAAASETVAATEPITDVTESTATDISTDTSSETIPTESISDTSSETIPTTEPTEESSLSTAVTSIKLHKSGTTIYVGKTALISPVIKNSYGATTYLSDNNKVAAVTPQGKIKGIKKGTATITVTNNGATAQFTVKVVNPKLSVKSITVVQGSAVKVSITGRAKGTSNKYVSTKYATVKTKSKTAKTITIKGKKVTPKTTLKIRVNGVWLKLKVKVRKPTEFDKHFKYKVVFAKKVKKLTKNLGTPNTPLSDLIDFYIDSNYSELIYSGIRYEKVDKWYDKAEKLAGDVKYSVANKNIATIKKDELIPVGKGETILTAESQDKTLTIPIKITKADTITYKSKKAKVVYSYKDVYKVLRSLFYDSVIKGEKPKYEYLACCFKTGVSGDIMEKCESYAYKDIDNGLNFYHYVCDYEVGIDFDLLDDCDKPNKYYSIIQIVGLHELKNHKKVYDAAQKIFKTLEIDKYTSDYQKLIALTVWLHRNCSYGGVPEVNHSPVYDILIHHIGVCYQWAETTSYLCTLLKIPCLCVDAEGHAWNLIKLNDKWYHTDILWKEILVGDNTVKNMRYHAPFMNLKKLEASEASTVSETDYDSGNAKRTLERLLGQIYRWDGQNYYQYKIKFSSDFFNSVFGWNGAEQINIKTLELELAPDE